MGEFGRTMGVRGEPAEGAYGVMAHSWRDTCGSCEMVERATFSDEGIIERRHLSLQPKTVSAASPNDLSAMERQTIVNVLRQTDWNKSKTARQLGLTRTQLYVRLRRYGLENAETM